MPKVTVLMPVHNGAEYLREAIESVLAQTLSDFEFLIVDDASVDDSPGIVRSYSDARIRYIRSEKRLKLAGALNLGISEAQGEFVARMDCDDICLSRRLEEQVSYLERHSDVIMCGSAFEKFGSGYSGKNLMPMGYEYIRAFMLFDNPFAHPTVMWRRHLFEQAKADYDESYSLSEDYAIWSEMIDYGNCDNLKKSLLKYRIHSSSMTRADPARMDRYVMRIQKKLLNSLGLDPTDDELLVHRYGCTYRLYPQWDQGALIILGEWFNKLQRCNDKSGLYEPGAFSRCISYFWYAACYHAMKNMKTSSGITSCYYALRPPKRGVWGHYYDLLFMLARGKHIFSG